MKIIKTKIAVIYLIIGFILGGVVVGYFANQAIHSISKGEDYFFGNFFDIKKYSLTDGVREFKKAKQFWPLYKESESVQQIMNAVRARENEPDLMIYFTVDADTREIKKLYNEIKAMGAQVEYVSKEKAFATYKELNKNNPEVLELVSVDILPASLKIRSKSKALLDKVAKLAKEKSFVDEIINK